MLPDTIWGGLLLCLINLVVVMGVLAAIAGAITLLSQGLRRLR